jgi:glycosyltransferase involved in cell wall biosynthesis
LENDKNFADGSLETFLAERCDIALGTFGDTLRAGTVMVNKIIEAVSMGIPVLCRRTKALSEYFTDNVNIFFAERDPERIADKIIDLSSKKELMSEVGRNSAQVYTTYFSRKSFIGKISNILQGEQ